MRFYSKFHGKFVDDLLGIAIDDESDGVLGLDAALVAVEELVFGDLRGGSLMLYDGRLVLDVHIGEGVCTAVATRS